MNQTGHAALEFRFHRHHIAAVPHGNHRILQGLGAAGGGNHAVEGFPYPGGGNPNIPANIPQGGAGVIRHLLLRKNRLLNFFLQIFIPCQPMKIVLQRRFHLTVLFQIPLGGPGGPQQSGDIQQLLLVQTAAGGGSVQRRRNVPHARKRRTAKKPGQLNGVFRLPLQTLAGDYVLLRLQRQSHFLGLGGNRLPRQQLQHLRQLQRAAGFSL